MKKISFFSLTFIAAIVCKIFAADLTTNEWGSVACDAQISVQLRGSGEEIKTNQPIELAIRIKNVSTNETLHVFQSLAVVVDSYVNFSYVVISPSGKDISPKHAKVWNGGSAADYFIAPGQSKEFGCNLGYVCKFEEIGTYEVFVKKRFSIDVNDKCEITSSPLYIKISK